MTRNEPADADLYDADFLGWTQREAAALRALPANTPIDIVHLAEEIEDLGKRDLREVTSYLRLVLQHLIKLRAASDSRDAAHWHAETANFQAMARDAFSPSMRRLIDVDEVWKDGCRIAARVLQDHGAGVPRRTCPFSLDGLLDRDFDVAAATKRIDLER